jgi:hypothetical protein
MGVARPQDVQIYNPEFSKMFSAIVRGRGAKNKRLQPGFNLWGEENLVKVLAGFLDGDSSCFIRNNTTIAKIYTSSYLILQQMEIICHKLNIMFSPCVVSKRPLQTTPAFAAELRFKDERVREHSIKMQRIAFLPTKYEIKHELFEPITTIKKMWMWDKNVWDVTTQTKGFTCGMIRNHNSFHTGGTVGSGLSGYPRIKQLLQLPKIVVGAAALAPLEGKITKITPGLAGGFDVFVEGTGTHVEKGLELKVKLGQKVVAGDPLSNGVIKPQDLVKYKGMQPAQEYITDELHKAYQSQGIGRSRKIFETVVRSLGNTTQVLNNPKDTGHLPGDIISYTVAEHHNKNLGFECPINECVGYKLATPLEGMREGHLLEQKDMLLLKAKGHLTVAVVKEAIQHAPILKGLSMLPILRRDWMAALGYRHLAKNLVEGAGQGWTTDLEDYHPVPAFVHGATFGQGKEGKY